LQADALRFDHAVIVVENLAAAIEGFREIGFTVVAGGDHEGSPTHNALIGLADGAYLELIAFRRHVAPPGLNPADASDWERIVQGSDSPLDRMMRLWDATGQGLVHFALCPLAVDITVAHARAHRLAIDGPYDGGRVRPDGRHVLWQAAMPRGLDTPFLCADVTDRSLRVPGGDDALHENGAIAVDRITVAVRDLAVAIPKYTALLGEDSRPVGSVRIPEADALDYPLGDVTVTVAAPTSESGPLAAHLRARGEGVYELRLGTTKPDFVGPLDPVVTRGSRIELVSAGNDR
jgi:hypothetical protein